MYLALSNQFNGTTNILKRGYVLQYRCGATKPLSISEIDPSGNAAGHVYFLNPRRFHARRAESYLTQLQLPVYVKHLITHNLKF